MAANQQRRHSGKGGKVNDEDDRPADGERTYAPAQDRRAGCPATFVAEASTLAISRLAASCERPGDGAAVTSVRWTNCRGLRRPTSALACTISAAIAPFASPDRVARGGAAAPPPTNCPLRP